MAYLRDFKHKKSVEAIRQRGVGYLETVKLKKRTQNYLHANITHMSETDKDEKP